MKSLEGRLALKLSVLLVPALVIGSAEVLAENEKGDDKGKGKDNSSACADLPSYAELTAALEIVVDSGGNAGFGNEMWASIVNREGIVCAVTFSGEDFEDQWPGSRVISAQKANTANAFSLEGVYPNLPDIGRALSTGNLYGLVLPGGSLHSLQFSNPVDTAVAYGNNPRAHNGSGTGRYGTANDPMVGELIGGVNIFGGGLALYDESGALIGALGVSGDTSCTDHIVAWRVRDELGLDNIPGGVAEGGPNGTDNLILADPPAPNTFEHPVCGFGEDPIIEGLPTTSPIGPTEP
jgi:Haem-degrading